jgi:hypothetical protein
VTSDNQAIAAARRLQTIGVSWQPATLVSPNFEWKLPGALEL